MIWRLFYLRSRDRMNRSATRPRTFTCSGAENRAERHRRTEHSRWEEKCRRGASHPCPETLILFHWNRLYPTHLRARTGENHFISFCAWWWFINESFGVIIWVWSAVELNICRQKRETLIHMIRTLNSCKSRSSHQRFCGVLILSMWWRCESVLGLYNKARTQNDICLVTMVISLR